MDYKLITEIFEDIINISGRGIEIISNDEDNKNNKLQVKVNDMMKLLGDIAGEINRNSIENHYFRSHKDKEV